MLRFVDNFADATSGTNKYAQYQYIGSSMIVSISHPDVTGGLNLSYSASGTYGGWDRFGRIVDQLWTDDSAATIDEIGHSYDRNSNRLTRTNGLNSALDEVYAYDGLDRLIDTNRNGANLQDWSLDALGNWRGFTDGADTQTRTNNAANEITGIAGVGWIAPVYDAAGNMTSGPKPGDETTRLHFKYDAWNRLTEVKDDNVGTPGTTIASYEYDGRNYRVEKTIGADTFDVFYNEAWQVLEVRQNGDTDPLEQNIWDLRYVDAPIVRFLDANTDGDYADATDSTLYYVQDANFNVTALVDAATGNVVERYSYDPYGKATVYDANWNVRAAGTAYANELQYAGYRLDPETGLYQVRNRFYHIALATWISRDPIGYASGINLFEYVGSNPANYVDPTGLLPPVTIYTPYGDPVWGSDDFVSWYYVFGRPVHLDDIGLSGIFWGSDSVQAAVDSFDQKIAAQIAKHLAAATCDSESYAFYIKDNVVTDVTSTIFSIGHSTFYRNATIWLKFGDCDCNGNLGYRVKISKTYKIRDVFKDPLDIGIEPGGTPYQINGDWKSGFEYSGTVQVDN